MNNNVVFVKSVLVPDHYTVFADSTRKGTIHKEGKQWILIIFDKPRYYTFKGSLADCVQEAREML